MPWADPHLGRVDESVANAIGAFVSSPGRWCQGSPGVDHSQTGDVGMSCNAMINGLSESGHRPRPRDNQAGQEYGF